MKVEGLPVDVQIQAALARTARDVSEAQGRAALSLIEGVTEAPRVERPDGTGSIIDTVA